MITDPKTYFFLTTKMARITITIITTMAMPIAAPNAAMDISVVDFLTKLAVKIHKRKHQLSLY